MEQDVERYRGPCLITSKRGGYKGDRGKFWGNRGGHYHGYMGARDQFSYSSGFDFTGIPLFSAPRRGRSYHDFHKNQNYRQYRDPSQKTYNSDYYSGYNKNHWSSNKNEQKTRFKENKNTDKSLDKTSKEIPTKSKCIKSSSTVDDLEHLPLSKLALHTQVVPIVISETAPTSDSSTVSTSPISCDTISITSDEGSTCNSETSLPRIIKPRKRRKKDRKPSGTSTTTTDTTETSEQSSTKIVTLKPYLPMCQGMSRACGCFTCHPDEVFPTPPPSPAQHTSSSEDDDCQNKEVTSTTGPRQNNDLQCKQWYRTYSESSYNSYANYSINNNGTYRLWKPKIEYEDYLGRGTLVRSLSDPYYAGDASFSFNTMFDGNRPQRFRHNSTPPSNSLSLDYNWQSKVRTPAPNDREWIVLAEADTARPSSVFTVMCYNVLCDKYATRQMYGYCPPWALEWEYRKKRIMDEIRRYGSDIITLQEVETEQFYNFFLPGLKNEGYDGIFSPKSRAKHMTENERKHVDGCAIFWRTKKFSLVKEHLIEFNQLAMANHDGSEDMLNRVMTKDNIGLAALLETREAAWGDALPEKGQINQPILVCTAHIHWDPEFCDVKLIQTIMLMSEIRGIVNQIVEDTLHRPGGKYHFQNIHLLLCGDLNSLPESGVVEFLTKGNVSMDHNDFKGHGYKTSLQKIALSRNNTSLANLSANIYTHSFRLSGAYDYNIMPYTNYTYDFKGIIDYIFHSTDTIQVLGVLGPVDPEWFRIHKVVGCPHPHIPSDHFPLLVQMELKPFTSTPMSHSNGMLHR